MCKAIECELFFRVSKEAEVEYESGRERAVREATEKARGILEKENESK